VLERLVLARLVPVLARLRGPARVLRGPALLVLRDWLADWAWLLRLGLVLPQPWVSPPP
jgi:hypothetical protein